MENQSQAPVGNIEVPKIEIPKKTEKGSGLKQLFITLLILTLGLLAIVYVGDQLSATLPTAPGIDSLQTLLRSTGLTIVYALAAITGLVFIAWLVARRGK